MRFYFVSLLAVALLFAPISARRIRRQAEPETTTESGATETSTGLNNSGDEASGEESGIDASGAEGSGLESSGIDASGAEESGLEASGIDASGSEGSGFESSGIDASGAEASGLEGSERIDDEINDGARSADTGDASGEEPIEGQISPLTLANIQASALTIQAQADAVALQAQAINSQLNTLTQDVQRISESAKKLNSQASNAMIQAGSTPITSTNQTLVGSNVTCTLDRACFSDSECNGGTCLGAFVGTCNCNACFQFTACTNDSQCGGLKTACNNVTRTCDCFQAYTNHGFSSFFDALTTMCNKKECTPENNIDACFGLPCNAGRCTCETTTSASN